MKTKQETAVKAYTALWEMAKRPLNSLAAYRLFRLKKALTPVLEFQVEQEEKIIADLGGTVADSGAVRFDNLSEDKVKERQIEYIKKRRELNGMECEVDIDKQSMSVAEIPDISIHEMETLDDFIDWKE